MRKLVPLVSLILLGILLLVPVWVLADTYTYYVPITIYNNGSEVQGPIGIIVTINNAQLAELGYINSSGLDTDILEGATSRVYAVVEENVGVFIEDIDSYQSNSYQYRLGYSPEQSGFPVIVGTGNIMVSDDSSMELGDNFTIEIDGYIDTSSGSDKNLVHKMVAFRADVSDTGSITAGVLDGASFNSTSSDGYIYKTGAVYSTVRTSVSGDSLTNTTTSLYLGQSYGGGVYSIYKSYVYFNTSPIPDAENIVSAWLRLYGMDDWSDTDFSITIQNGQPIYPHDPLILSDYNMTLYSGDGGAFNTTGFITTGYNDIEFSTTGLGWINVTGMTKLCLRSSREIAGNTPTGSEHLRVYAMEVGSSQEPELVVQYAPVANVTATGVSSGLHTIKIFADTANMTMVVDGVEEDSVALGAVSVPDNAYDWYLSEGGSLPYMTSYEHGAGPVNYTYYNTGEDSWSGPYGTSWIAQTFTPSVSHKVTSVKLLLYRIGSPGTVTVGIRATDVDGHPTGADLAFGTTDGNTLTTSTAGEWREIYLSAGYDLTASTKYAIVVRALTGDNSNKPEWLRDESSPTYTGGNYEVSDDSGSTWSGLAARDFMFEDWGAGPVACWFEPNSMPSAGNLPDRSGNGNTGTMTFGNPSWAEVTVGGILPISAYVAPGGALDEPPEVLLSPTDLELFEDTSVTGEGLPLYESVSRAADSMGWSTPVLYSILILIVCATIGLAGFVASGSIIGFSVGFGVTAAAAGGTGVFPWWIAMVCVMFALMAGYTWRHT